MGTLRSNYTQEIANGAYSKSISTPFVIPADLNSQSQEFDNVAWINVGQAVYFGDATNGGHFKVTSVNPGTGTITLFNEWNSAIGTIIPVGGKLSPAGIPGTGDMRKTVYDANNDGVVDDSDRLGGQLPSYYEVADPTILKEADIGVTLQPYDANTVIDANYVATENSYTTTEKNKLAGIEAGATADQTGAEIKTLYEAEADTNAYTDAEKTKLAGIASGAEVNVQSDWNAVSGDAFILNKPSTFPPSSHTQTASTITDFDTEVSNNTDVAANTSARHVAVTVVDSSEIDLTLTGQQISASLVAGSIDETKLDTSVNASLDLADSALQPGTIGVTVQGYDANTVIDSAYVHTDNNYTTTEKNKLAGIADGAEVNVNADWNAVSGDSQILNKPTLGTAAATDSTDYATAAQGALADTALQPDQAETISGNYTFNGALFLPNNSRISGVEHFYQPDKPTHRGNDDVTALVPGDRWWKTDDGTEWFWNGTYWISTNINYTGGRRTSGNSAPNFAESTEWDYSQGRLVLIRTASVFLYLGSAGDTNNYIYFGVNALLRNAGSISLYNSTNKMFSSGVNSIVDEAVSVVVLKDYSTVNVVGLYFNLYTVGSPPSLSFISGSIAWSLIYE